MALYILIAVQFVPETPRFLLSKGRDEEAFQFLVEYHGNGNRQDELVLFEFEEMKETIRAEQAGKAEKWGTIMKNRPNRHRIGLAALMTFLTNVRLHHAYWTMLMRQLSGTSIIYFYCKHYYRPAADKQTPRCSTSLA